MNGGSKNLLSLSPPSMCGYPPSFSRSNLTSHRIIPTSKRNLRRASTNKVNNTPSMRRMIFQKPFQSRTSSCQTALRIESMVFSFLSVDNFCHNFRTPSALEHKSRSIAKTEQRKEKKPHYIFNELFSLLMQKRMEEFLKESSRTPHIFF